MLDNILHKLYNTKETPEILLFRQKVECISEKLEYLKTIEPKTEADFRDIRLVMQYVSLMTEVNIEIVEIYNLDIF